MGNVLDYVRREFRGFAELPFGDVDSLVLSELSYMRLTDLVPTFGEAKSVATCRFVNCCAPKAMTRCSFRIPPI